MGDYPMEIGRVPVAARHIGIGGFGKHDRYGIAGDFGKKEPAPVIDIRARLGLKPKPAVKWTADMIDSAATPGARWQQKED